MTTKTSFLRSRCVWNYTHSVCVSAEQHNYTNYKMCEHIL